MTKISCAVIVLAFLAAIPVKAEFQQVDLTIFGMD